MIRAPEHIIVPPQPSSIRLPFYSAVARNMTILISPSRARPTAIRPGGRLHEKTGGWVSPA
jgi:hypothetical protein